VEPNTDTENGKSIAENPETKNGKCILENPRLKLETEFSTQVQTT
jgi:hypothetical protein